MNKLVFILKRDFNDIIMLIANNHKDLEDYLNKTYDFYMVIVRDDSVEIVEREGYEHIFGELTWAKHI